MWHTILFVLQNRTNPSALFRSYYPVPCLDIAIMDIGEYIDSLFEQIDGIQYISLRDSEGKEVLSKSDPKGTQMQYLPFSKSSLTDLFIKQCKDSRLLTRNEKECSRLETLVTYTKTLQFIQFSFNTDEYILYFTVVAMQNVKTGVLMELFRNTIIPIIKSQP